MHPAALNGGALSEHGAHSGAEGFGSIEDDEQRALRVEAARAARTAGL
jgi:hypothetical protein